MSKLVVFPGNLDSYLLPVLGAKYLVLSRHFSSVSLWKHHLAATPHRGWKPLPQRKDDCMVKQYAALTISTTLTDSMVSKSAILNLQSAIPMPHAIRLAGFPVGRLAGSYQLLVIGGEMFGVLQFQNSNIQTCFSN